MFSFLLPKGGAGRFCRKVTPFYYYICVQTVWIYAFLFPGKRKKRGYDLLTPGRIGPLAASGETAGVKKSLCPLVGLGFIH